MGDFGPGFRRDHVTVTSGRVYAARDGSPEFARYTTEVARPRRGPKKNWVGLSDPEMRRKKRIVKYKVYAVEGKVKASIKKGLRWFKNKVSKLVHGY